MENTKNLEITGWTDNPADHEFKESYMSPGGAEIRDRFTIYLEPEDREQGSDNVRLSKFRVNFWGQWAKEAYEALVVGQQRALIKLKEPKVTPYVDKYEGRQRVSLNVNFRSQYEILDSEHCPIGNGFELILNKIKNRDVNAIMDVSPFSNPF